MSQREYTPGRGTARGRRGGRWLLGVFLVVFGLFLANVLLGKAQILFGWRAPFLLNDVSEYLVLLASALLFTMVTLLRETERGDQRRQDE